MTATGERSLRAIGERLRLTREALGLIQADFAKRARVSASAYNQYEKGKMRPAVDQAIKICDAFRHKGISLDWIYLGNNSEMKDDLREAIKALRQARG